MSLGGSGASDTHLNSTVNPAYSAFVVDAVDQTSWVSRLQGSAGDDTSNDEPEECHRRPRRTEQEQEQYIRTFPVAILNLHFRSCRVVSCRLEGVGVSETYHPAASRSVE